MHCASNLGKVIGKGAKEEGSGKQQQQKQQTPFQATMNSFQDWSKKYHLVTDLQTKISVFEEAIKKNADLQMSIKGNVEKVKSEIHLAVNSQISLLLSREEQLLRQVDVLASNESISLQTQNAELHYTLGLLESYLHTTEDVPLVFIMEKINKEIDKIKCFEIKKLPLLKFDANLDTLPSAIQCFGNIETTGSMLCFPHFEESRCLPSKVEEYDDGDHHVLHKTLENSSEKENLPAKANSQQGSDWLRKLPALSATYLVDNAKKNSPTGTPTQAERTQHFSSVQDWLRTVTMEEETEPICNSTTGLQQVSWTDCQNSTSGESIVMLSLPKTSVDELPPPSSPVAAKVWKFDWWPSSESERKEKVESSACCKNLNSETCQANKKANEDAKDTKSSSSVETNKWLDKNSANADGKSALPKVADVCCANEPCKNLYECLFDKNCGLAQALPKPLDKASILIQPMLNTMYGQSNNWLSDSNRKQRQELPKSPPSSAKSTKSLRQLHFFNEQSNNVVWYRPNNNNSSPNSKPKWSIDCANEKIQKSSCKMAAMFEKYFEPLDLNLWLSNKTAA